MAAAGSAAENPSVNTAGTPCCDVGRPAQIITHMRSPGHREDRIEPAQQQSEYLFDNGPRR
jgi:hypothetical protein